MFVALYDDMIQTPETSGNNGTITAATTFETRYIRLFCSRFCEMELANH